MAQATAAALVAAGSTMLLAACTSGSESAQSAESARPSVNAMATTWPRSAGLCPTVTLGAITTLVSHESGACPWALPVGRNQAALVGIELERVVSFDVPEVGWTASAAGQGGFELTGPRGETVTVFPYPLLGGGAPEPSGGSQMLTAFRTWTDLQVLDAGPWPVGRYGGIWMDLTPAPRAVTTDYCRRESPCLPLVVALLDATASEPVRVELRPGVVSRLLVEQAEERRLQAAVWVPESPRPNSTVEHLVDSLRFGDARLQVRTE